MKNWTDCPDCWGTGYLHGIGKPCDTKRPGFDAADATYPTIDLVEWLREDPDARQALHDVLRADHYNCRSRIQSLTRLIVRFLVREAVLSVLDDLPIASEEFREGRLKSLPDPADKELP